MVAFRPLASSSSGCSYILRCDGFPSLLIDAGISFKDIQKATKFQVSKLAGCLISHAHGDHIKAAKDLMNAGVDCYASKETWELCGYGHHRQRFLEPMISRLIEPLWHVLPFTAVHDLPGTLGFLIGAPDGSRVLYLTDSAYSPYKFEGLTHICIEANFGSEIIRDNARTGRIHGSRRNRTTRTHMSIERLIDMLKANDLSKVEEIWLLHLSAENSDSEGFKRQVQEATGCPTFIAEERSV